ncbi:MAG: hypothetical protein QMB81_01030, partial [Pontimonas sp.]
MSDSNTPVRPPRSRWSAIIWIAPLSVLVLFAVVMGAQAVRGIPSVNSFMLTYPGHSDLPSDAPVG